MGCDVHDRCQRLLHVRLRPGHGQHRSWCATPWLQKKSNQKKEKNNPTPKQLEEAHGQAPQTPGEPPPPPRAGGVGWQTNPPPPPPTVLPPPNLAYPPRNRNLPSPPP